MNIPSSTYRIQLHAGFTFQDLQRILEYLHTLGISTVYASPVTTATPDSMHGYDVTDPGNINPEIGKADDLKSIARELRKKDMLWLQDIVPNHMAFHPLNYRLMDVLERGPASPYYNYFDIDWNHDHPALRGKLMVPFLGDEWDRCLENGEIKLAFTPKGLVLQYFDTQYPLSVPGYERVKELAKEHGGHETLTAMIDNLVSAAPESGFEAWQAAKREFVDGVGQTADAEERMDEVLKRINDHPAVMNDVADALYYRLYYWKTTDRMINYRRFFTVNELICLRMEDEKVFDEYHTYLLRLYKEKLVQGFRIDHIDGLQDPATYTQMLRQSVGDSCYIIAEKILEAREEMPAQWPIEGTSGYEFLSFLNQLLTYRKGARQLLEFYRELLPDMPSYRRLIFDSKKLILETYMAGEWANLTRLFCSLRLAGTFDPERIRHALGFFMLSLPVYRIYPAGLPLKGKSLLTLHEAFERALAEGSGYREEISYMRDLLTTLHDDTELNTRILQFLKRLMQFTGPLTAKGVEDTTFYIYNPLISHDEVGDSPSPLGMSIQRFHEKMAGRQATTPLSLNATATHDTKRGEDARVRINVLSRIPELWQQHVTHWLGINAGCRREIGGRTAPALNDEYFIYQSMLGGFPENFTITDEWVRRVQAYLNKALREAKVNTNWTEPDEEYEKACGLFLEDILKPDHPFLSSFIPFVRIVCEHAMVYTLSQTLIKLTAPGIPDVYQGCELWDLSFVDPDNRRPVDYEKRMQFLFQLVLREEKGKEAVFEYLREHREAGIEKLYLTWKTLNFRRRDPLLFTAGDYVPLSITGTEISALAYARVRINKWVIVVIPLGLITHDQGAAAAVSQQYLVLPDDAPAQWAHLFTGQSFEAANQISLRDLLRSFPVALLTGEHPAVL